jgi:signal peptidase II
MRKLALAAFAALLVGCDHATKAVAQGTLAHAPPITLAQLEYAENRDVAFSLLGRLGVTKPAWALAGVVVAALVLIAWSWWRRRAEPDVVVHLAFASVLSGAIGNLVDRIVRGYVVDFIHVRGWPVFNVADVAVVAGALLFYFRAWRNRSPWSPRSRPSTSR